MRSFGSLLPSRCAVIRDKIDQYIFVHHLVVGDLVRVKEGDKFPADLRLLHANGICVIHVWLF